MKTTATILLLLKRVDCNDGVASYLESLITGLREAGDRVVIVSGEVTTLYGSEARRRRIEAAVTEWIVIDSFRAAWPKFSHVKQIIATIDRHGVDIVSPQGFAVLPIGCLAARACSRPVVTNFHLLPTIRPRWKALQHLAYRVVARACQSDRYIAMSTEIEHFFRVVCDIPQRRIHKQMLGVDTDFFRPPSDQERRSAKSRFGLDETTFVAILSARMNRTKGHDLAAEAFRVLRKRRPDAITVCLFAGAGDEREAIEADVLQNDADREMFRFLGFIDRVSLRDAYWAADIILLPSRIEGFGLVVAEAMCCGAIVIRTPSGGWQDQVVEGRTGYAVPFDNPPALASAIEKVMLDANRPAMREAAMQLATSSFSRSRMIAGTSRLYREIAVDRRLRRPAFPSKTT